MKEKNIKVASRLSQKKGKTDWNRLSAASDADIDASTVGDSDWENFNKIDWSKAEIVTPVRKEPISIRVDADVLEFFRKSGDGYQSRINSVLRSFMKEMQRTKLHAKSKKKRA